MGIKPARLQSWFTAAVVLIASFAAPVAHATAWHVVETYFAYYDFRVDQEGKAFGKKVKAVYAHTGVSHEQSHCSGTPTTGTYWDQVQHVQMNQVGLAFFAKLRFETSDGECQGHPLGLVVQYWVYFEDGTTLITDVAKLPLAHDQYVTDEDKYDQAVQTDGHFFNSAYVVPFTFADRVRYGWAS